MESINTPTEQSIFIETFLNKLFTYKKTSIAEKLVGKQVLIRTYSAGVHYGTLSSVSDDGDNYKVELTNARRVYQWTGAFTLSEYSTIGSTRTDSKLSVFIPRIFLNAIEIIEMTDVAYNNLKNIKTFTP